jgi:predicted transcriptional regulator
MLEAKVAGHHGDAQGYAVQLRWDADPRPTNARTTERGVQPTALHQDMPVSRIMTRAVVTLRVDTTVEAATEKILAERISGAPVVDAAGRPIGMVCKTDLLEAWQQVTTDGESAEAAQVGDIMVPYLLAVSHRAPIALATALMAYEGVHRLVVLGENNQMVGIVSSLDILRWVAELSGFGLPHAAGPRGPERTL